MLRSLSIKRENKQEKLLQYAERVWKITEGTPDERISAAIEKTVHFFESVGVPTRLSAHGVGQEAISAISQKLERQGVVAFGEKQDVTAATVKEILALSA